MSYLHEDLLAQKKLRNNNCACWLQYHSSGHDFGFSVGNDISKNRPYHLNLAGRILKQISTSRL